MRRLYCDLYVYIYLCAQVRWRCRSRVSLKRRGSTCWLKTPAWTTRRSRRLSLQRLRCEHLTTNTFSGARVWVSVIFHYKRRVVPLARRAERGCLSPAGVRQPKERRHEGPRAPLRLQEVAQPSSGLWHFQRRTAGRVSKTNAPASERAWQWWWWWLWWCGLLTVCGIAF